MANKEHLTILRSGASIWNKWRSEHRGIRPDLVGADLHMANLSEADLSGADIRTAHFGRADLRTANLNGADLFATNLSGANLCSAMLINTDMHGADLCGADLSDSQMWLTSVSNIDLRGGKGLETVKHLGPSSIGIDTISRSKGIIPRVFLERAGVPKAFILYMDSFIWGDEFPPCFICHSAKDEDFPRRLLRDLQGRGVPCWFFSEDATWGEPVWREIDNAVNTNEKILVLCSEASLQSGPVLREIDRALQREDREHKNILFPIQLDDYLLQKWNHHRKADVVNKVVGDFRGHEDQMVYDKAFGRLILALNKSQGKGGA